MCTTQCNNGRRKIYDVIRSKMGTMCAKCMESMKQEMRKECYSPFNSCIIHKTETGQMKCLLHENLFFHFRCVCATMRSLIFHSFVNGTHKSQSYIIQKMFQNGLAHFVFVSMLISIWDVYARWTDDRGRNHVVADAVSPPSASDPIKLQ